MRHIRHVNVASTVLCQRRCKRFSSCVWTRNVHGVFVTVSYTVCAQFESGRFAGSSDLFCAVQFLINITALVVSRYSQASKVYPVQDTRELPEDVTVRESVDERSVVSLDHSGQKNESSVSISYLEP